MTTEFGRVFTRADIVSAVESVKAVSSVASSISAGTGGSGLGDIERVLGFIERAVPLFEKAASTMMQLRGYEAGQRPNAETPQPYMDVEPLPLPPAPAPGPVASSPRVSPIRVYAAALGALADLEKLDPNLTVSKALVMAREYKEMILPKIEEIIPTLLETPDA